MRVIAVPVKALGRSKSRLHPLLSPLEILDTSGWRLLSLRDRAERAAAPETTAE